MTEVDDRFTGTIKTLLAEKGYGFIAGDDGIEYFFHRSDAVDFAGLSAKACVEFLPRGGAKGPRAIDVRRLD